MQNKKYLVANKNQIEKIQKLIVADENQIEVRQNAGDEASPLTCSPECPQVICSSVLCLVVFDLWFIVGIVWSLKGLFTKKFSIVQISYF